jgi:alkylated DNA nucleotide flippase Atl1
MLIASPAEVLEVLKSIPRGSLLTLSTLRATLAAKHEADYACPMTTGIFLRIAAEAIEEHQREKEDGLVSEFSALFESSEEMIPYWRVVRDDGELIDKLPGGIEAQADKLRAEGHVIMAKGKRGLRVRLG